MGKYLHYNVTAMECVVVYVLNSRQTARIIMLQQLSSREESCSKRYHLRDCKQMPNQYQHHILDHSKLAIVHIATHGLCTSVSAVVQSKGHKNISFTT